MLAVRATSNPWFSDNVTTSGSGQFAAAHLAELVSTLARTGDEQLS